MSLKIITIGLFLATTNTNPGCQPTPPIDNNTGGSSGTTGGSSGTTGGSLGITGGTSGIAGSSIETGGGLSLTGGTPGTGGLVSTGGKNATGGKSAATGGNGTGGARATGGNNSTGGLKATGGNLGTGGTTSLTPEQKACTNIVKYCTTKTYDVCLSEVLVIEKLNKYASIDLSCPTNATSKTAIQKCISVAAFCK